MKKLSIILLVVMISTVSCSTNHEKSFKKSEPTAFQPKPLYDDWSKWLVGEWEGSGESNAGKGKYRIKAEMGLNGQFLIIKGEAEIAEMTDEQKRYLKNTLHASDEEVEKFQSSTFKSLEIYTIDPRTGEVVGYMFDSLRCIAHGRGRREGNKEVMKWEWSGSGQGASSISTIEKVNNDKLISIQTYALPNGGTMEDRGEMIRKK